jgi:hypothetical protein
MPSIIITALQSDGNMMPMRVVPGMTVKIRGMVPSKDIAEEVTNTELGRMSITELKDLLDSLKYNLELKGSGLKGKMKKEDYVGYLLKYWNEWFDGEEEEEEEEASSSGGATAAIPNEDVLWDMMRVTELQNKALLGQGTPSGKGFEIEVNTEKNLDDKPVFFEIELNTEKKIDDKPDWYNHEGMTMGCRTCKMAWATKSRVRLQVR